MGYYTQHWLTVEEGDITVQEIMSKVDEDSELYYTFDEDGHPTDAIKGYKLDEYMKELSLQYKDVVLMVKGEGEDNEDTWKKYFKNGKMQECYAKIIFDEYDESQLR